MAKDDPHAQTHLSTSLSFAFADIGLVGPRQQGDAWQYFAWRVPWACSAIDDLDLLAASANSTPPVQGDRIYADRAVGYCCREYSGREGDLVQAQYQYPRFQKALLLALIQAW